MLSEITKGQLLAHQLGRLKDAGNMDYTQVSLAKRNNVAMALETARLERKRLRRGLYQPGATPQDQIESKKARRAVGPFHHLKCRNSRPRA